MPNGIAPQANIATTAGAPPTGIVPTLPEPRKDYKLSAREEIGDREELEKSLKLDLSPTARTRLENELHTAIDQDLRDMSDKLDKWELLEELFDGITHPKSFPFAGCSNLHIPLTRIKIKKCLSRTKKGLITNVEPIWTITPRETTDVARVDKMEKFIHYSSTIEMEIDVPLNDVFEDAAKLGTGILELPFVWEVETVNDTGEYNGEIREDVEKFLAWYPDAEKRYPELYTRLMAGEKLLVEEEYDDEVYRGPKPQYVERQKFVVPKGYKELKKMPRYFKEIELSWDELQDGVESDLYDEEAVDRVKFKKGKLLSAKEYTERKYVAYEGMFKCDPKTDDGTGTRQKCIFTYLFDEKIIIRGNKYPYKHARPYFIAFRIMRNPRDFDGRSLAEEVADLNVEMNIVHNLNIDSHTIANVPTFKTTSQRLNLAIERWYPGKTWQLDRMDELEQFQTANLGDRSSFNLEALAMKYADLVTGIPEYMAGAAETKDPKAPARKAEILLGEGYVDLGDYINTLKRGMKETGFIIGQLFLQYGTKGKEYRVLNEQGEPAFEPAPSREDLRLRADFEPMGSIHNINLVASRESLIRFIDMALKEPIIANYPPARKYLWQELLKMWPEGNLDKKIPQILPPDEVITRWSVDIQKQALLELAQQEQQQAQGQV